jgi:acetyl esterase/lipase
MTAQAAPGDGVSTTSLGSDAPAYYEVGEPSGAFAGAQPKGVMLVINGGGWMANGSGAVEADRPIADRWRARGWRTLNMTYRPCTQSLDDVRWFYKRARELWGSGLPYCAHGASAGGHLAVSLAAADASLACAINEGGPVNAATLGNGTAWGAKGPQRNGPRWSYNLMAAAFGQENLAWYSPAIWPIKARVLVGVAAQDPYIPWAQATELRDRMRARDVAAYTDIVQLPAGSVPWTHASVSPAAIDDFHRREADLVAPLVEQS